MQVLMVSHPKTESFFWSVLQQMLAILSNTDRPGWDDLSSLLALGHQNGQLCGFGIFFTGDLLHLHSRSVYSSKLFFA